MVNIGTEGTSLEVVRGLLSNPIVPFTKDRFSLSINVPLGSQGARRVTEGLLQC